MSRKKDTNQWWAMYKGDEFIDMGTLEYLSKKYHVRKDTIRFYSTPTYKKRNHKNGLITFKV